MIHGGKPGAPITSLEIATLWCKSQGMTYPAMAVRLGTTRNSTQCAGQRVMRKLRTSNIREAVAVARQKGLLGPYMDCGSVTAQQRHRLRREPLCARCRLR